MAIYPSLARAATAPGSTAPQANTRAHQSIRLQEKLRYGMKSAQVRALQVRLRHAGDLALYDVTSRFGMKTKAAVKKFQNENDLPATGAVDADTWNALVARTPEPTPAELTNTDVGPWFVSPKQSVYMKELQHRLRQIHFYSGRLTGRLDEATKSAIRNWRADAGLTPSDVMDERGWMKLVKVSYNPSYAQLFKRPPQPGDLEQKLDPRCMTGKVICISKQQKMLSYVVDGKVKLTRKVNFARPGYESPKGDFRVWYRNWNVVSKIFGERVPMPYSIFYHGNVAVHFSGDFAAEGYDEGSHGCTQLRDYRAAKWLYEHSKVGERVVVY